MKKAKSAFLKSLMACFEKAKMENLRPSPVEDQTKVVRQPNNRRQFLLNISKASLAYSAAPLFAHSCFNNNNNPKIAVIGAGIAGLHCTYVLKKAGIYADLFEASSSLGGRIQTLEGYFGNGIRTEIGGEYIDSNHTDMFQLATELGLELLDTFEDFKDKSITKDAYHFNNQFYTESQVIEAFRPIVAKLESDKLSCGEDYDTDACAALDVRSLEEYVRFLDCEEWLKELLLSAYVAEFGLDAGNQSALNLVDLINADTKDGFQIFGASDERYKIKGGNKKIIEGLAKHIENQVQTGHKLAVIRLKGKKYELTFEKGKTLSYDFVVLCLPFSTLRAVEFQVGGISKEKLNCIQSLGYGQNNKLILGFNARPWRENGQHFSGYLFNNQIQNGWDCGHQQNGNVGETGYTLFLGGTDALMLAKESTATGAKDKVSKESVARYLQKMDTIFTGSSAAFNHKHYAALWSNNPYTKGSYACYTPGQWTSISGLEAEPIGNILFAGEHCSNDFQGFMNGGAETGRVAAETILEKVLKR